MSRTFRNIDPFYFSASARIRFPKEVVERYTDKRDGKAVSYVEAGGGIEVVGQLAKKFFKRRTNKIKRTSTKAEICSAVMQMVQEQYEYDRDMKELYDRIAEEEEYDNQRYSFLDEDDNPSDYEDYCSNEEFYVGDAEWWYDGWD
jgi:hypothetical protein